jgi:hypothetical protein
VICFCGLVWSAAVLCFAAFVSPVSLLRRTNREKPENNRPGKNCGPYPGLKTKAAMLCFAALQIDQEKLAARKSVSRML